jgi:hypothetical protein
VEVGDLLGLGDFVLNSKGERVSTKFFTPNWLKELIDYCEKNPKSHAVLFLDEMNRARRDVLQAVFQLVLDYKHFETILPKNMYVIAACNPSTDDYIVTDIADKALLNRFCNIVFTPTVEEWLEYATKKPMDRSLIEFYSVHKNLLDPSDLHVDIFENVKGTRRTVEKLGRFVELFKAERISDSILLEVMKGYVGKEVSGMLFDKIKHDALEKPITADQILNSYSEVSKKVEEYSDPNNSRHDTLSVTITELKNTELKDLSKKQFNNLMEFVITIPKDLAKEFLAHLFNLSDSMKDKMNECKKLFKRFS